MPSARYPASAAAVISSVDNPYPQVLRFDGTNHCRVGKLGPMDADLGLNFTGEFVFRGQNGYYKAWGWGGRHPWLDGPNGGNISVYASGSAEYGSVQHNTEYAPHVNEWVHKLLSSSSAAMAVVSRVFGIPDGLTRYASAKKDDGVTDLPGVDQRRVPSASQNAETFLGASASHSPFFGDLARIRLLDTDASHVELGMYLPTERYDPSPYWYNGGNKAWDVFYDFTDGLLIDKSIAGMNRASPYGGKHNLTRFKTTYGLEANQAPGANAEAFAGAGGPEFVRSSTCPCVTGTRPASTEPARTPTTPPANVLIYDSFGRAATTPWHTDTPDAGSTEAGSLGTRTWYDAKIVNADPNFPFLWAVMEGRLRPVVRTRGAIRVCNVGSPNFKIIVRARRGSRSPTHTGICFRQDGIPVTDTAATKNCFIAWTEDVSAWSANAQLRVRTMKNDVEDTVDGGTVPAFALGSDWTAIGVQCLGDTITLLKYVGNTETVLGSLTGQTTFQNATYAGVCQYGNDITNGGFCTYNAVEIYAAS